METIDSEFTTTRKRDVNCINLFKSSKWSVILGIGLLLWSLLFSIFISYFLMTVIEMINDVEQNPANYTNSSNYIEDFHFHQLLGIVFSSFAVIFGFFMTITIFRFAIGINKYKISNNELMLLRSFKSLKRFFIYGTITVVLILTAWIYSIYILSRF